MIAADLDRRLADQLLVQVGWIRHPERPGCFQHPETGLHVMVFPGEITLTLGADEHGRPDRGLSVRTAYYPQAGIDMIVEVAQALVLKRTVEAQRGRPRKGGMGLPAGDMLLVLCAQRGALTALEATDDPQWTMLAGWPRKPAVSTITKAVYELRGAGLIDTGPERRARLTPTGYMAAVEIARRLRIPLPDPVGAS